MSTLQPDAGLQQLRPYNIIPVDDERGAHHRYPEVCAAIAALRNIGNLPDPQPHPEWEAGSLDDLLDWLGIFFGFQKGNVCNQREHLVLHLANSHMCAPLRDDNIDVLNSRLVRRFRRKLLSNYTSWCSYLDVKSNIWFSGRLSYLETDLQRELLYVSLYLLIWGESANLRFMPECLCFIFHNMCMELNKILEGEIDENTGRPFLPSTSGGFLSCVVRPIYETIEAEVEASRNGTAPHSEWRNYDDFNEYFWSRRCFDNLKWPFVLSSNFFATSSKQRFGKKVGFVERRSFWNLLRSFDRLWLMLILFFQAAIIVAWEETESPWTAWQKRDAQVRLLTLFLTWSGFNFLQSLLDVAMQCRLISWETPCILIRMVSRCIVSSGWVAVFWLFYGMIKSQKHGDGTWSDDASRKITNFYKLAFLFALPELLSPVSFILRVCNCCCHSRNWIISKMITWWVYGSSFVGHGLQETIVDTIKYILFWGCVLFSKFSFSYLLQIKPMVSELKQFLNLGNQNYTWHMLLEKHHKIEVTLLCLPVVMIYMVDLQIWYSVYTSLVGVTIGLFSHLGEIRDIYQLRLRFQFFASAIQFHLLPEEQLDPKRRMRRIFMNAIHRWKLRYGFGQPYKKMESSQVEMTRFALIWNEIMVSFREEDIISDQEYELLELLPNSWDIRVIRWPCFLICNELLHALDLANDFPDAPDRWLWDKICKNEYRRCAVVEVYDSLKALLLEIINPNSEEHSIIGALFMEIDNQLQREAFTEAARITELPYLHTEFLKLVELLNKPNIDINQVTNTLRALYDISVLKLWKVKRSMKELMECGLAPSDTTILTTGLLFEDVRRLHIILSCRETMLHIPVNPEARRRIAFFSNSMFMSMPRAPEIERMLAFSVLTPYNDEEVMYSKEQLQAENKDRISILFYLQKVYSDEWENFLERMHREGMGDDEDIWTTKLRDLRLWASYRGQTLSRTVRGMMYYYRALKMLAALDSASEMDIMDGPRELDSASEMDIMDGPRELGSMRQDEGLESFDNAVFPSSKSLRRNGFSIPFLGHEEATVSMKFTYVVACQTYGAQKARKDPKAEEILYLMKNNKALRVAYVDEVDAGRDRKEYHSVLVKYDQKLKREVEIYRVQLPGPMKLGEGKPENQNHALIFTRGHGVQTIDMNQDNYFEEALKVRNLLEEFKLYRGIRKPTILGVREYIFTGPVSTLAWFMSAQETSFVALQQRVMANPLKIRMHYGHPDVFDRFWFLSRGGISKASKAINISEDVFAGFNCILRGGNVSHHEYIQVGKGREVGLNQICLFEAKIASGNGEQALSRDVYRLGQRLDFFRMLSFFHTTVGFFFSAMMMALTVYVFLWGRLYLALSGFEHSAMASEGNNIGVFPAILNQEFVTQLGLFTAIPAIVESTIEQGFLTSLWEFLMMQFQLSPVFYTFTTGTRIHFFSRTILHGGAKYRATGRGYSVQHKSFAENYRLYSRSHFIKAIELGLVLIVYQSYTGIGRDTFFYIDTAITCWFLILSWIFTPFLFNLSGFDWLKTVSDWREFMDWIWCRDGVFAAADKSWERWWYEEQDHLRTSGIWGKLLELVLALRFFYFQYGIVYKLNISAGSTSITVYWMSWIYVLVCVGAYMLIEFFWRKYAAKKHIYYRFVQALVITFAILGVMAMLKFTSFRLMDIFTSLLAFIPTGWGMILIAQVLRPILQFTGLWNFVVPAARLYDIMFGVIVMVPVAFLSWIPGFQSMQGRILFNEAFSRGLQLRPYNIIPVDDERGTCHRYPEVRAVIAALRNIGNLPDPQPDPEWEAGSFDDLLDWLGIFFGFQKGNVCNQREHLVLHLANSHMSSPLRDDNIDVLNSRPVRRFRRKLLGNYTSWCSYLDEKSSIQFPGRQSHFGTDLQRELLYVSLYLLIWGESANLRFMPECLCFVFHNMCMELNKILEGEIDKSTGRPFMPSTSGGFLRCVVRPIYETIEAEAEASRNGTAPHGEWRNYDDFNEYFWSRRCFDNLKWPFDLSSNFFATSSKQRFGKKVCFVEQRSFWNLLRSFDRLWLMLILFFQAAIIVAWEETESPWTAWEKGDVQVRLLTLFLTWSGYSLLQSLLDVAMQYRLVSCETPWILIRMVCRCIVSSGWVVVFWIFYGMVKSQKHGDGTWSDDANRKITNFHKLALVFVLPELLSPVSFILQACDCFQSRNWRISKALTWWVYGSSFVGHGLRESIVDTIKYILFWGCILFSKFSFSYLLQIKPMVSELKQFLNLGNQNYTWHMLLEKHHKIEVTLLCLPVVMIYMVDLQIWYSVYTSFVGVTIGLFSHLGEIRDIYQLRLRFQFFASAIQFHLLPEQQFDPKGIMARMFMNTIQRWKLRYGFGQQYRKMESSQVEMTRFALIWNEIMVSFREEDIISDQEFELLELLPNSWNIRVIRWPCFLICNELLHALDLAKDFPDVPDGWLWDKICNNEYRRCSVIEVYDSLKALLLEIIKPNSEEHSIIVKFFAEIDNQLQMEKFTDAARITELPQLHTLFLQLVELLNKPNKEADQVADALRALYEIGVFKLWKIKRTITQLMYEGLAPSDPTILTTGLLFEDAVQLPDPTNDNFYRQVRRLHTILTCRDTMLNIPANLEARRRIAFFSNSMFMSMPRAPAIDQMLAFSVLTPYNDEEVMCSKEQLQAENKDRISILFYLQKVYADEWENFMQRMRREGMEDDEDIWTTKLKDLRLWASYRGQTLARTVRGMMYYYRALKMLCFLDSASEMDIRSVPGELGSMRRDGGMESFDSAASPSSESLRRSGFSELYKGYEDVNVLMKFTYVVACQTYGAQKARKDPKAKEILYLMKNNKALRVAYVDEIDTGRDGKEYYSVLAKYDQQLRREVEIYRVQLPGPMKLGEGKPENQNHALIFTRGHGVQTIDMNQDNYFEEALKMRNLLEEFKLYRGIRKPTILGVREYIFTGPVSTLAWFMSAQETSFVALQQRVMANPLKIRMHYGHPDVFDRFWFLSRGGISKASKAINISEDVFAGFNCTLRGGNVTHHEYIQVGKGREVGLNQICLFEAKVASGNGEQALSRDVYRLGHGLDFFRMLSFFHSTVGFFFSAMMMALTVYAFLWGRLYLALSGFERSAMASEGNNFGVFSAILNQQFVIQLGLFTAIPAIVESTIEQGFLTSLWEFLMMQFQLSPVFYTFTMGTRTHFFIRTILHGGAKYRATGRGYSVQHKSFVENYRFYSRSHFIKAIELGLVLTVYQSYTGIGRNSFFYIDTAITCWFLILSWIFTPFLFNLSGFDWLKTVSDWRDFMDWIWCRHGVFAAADKSWERWWYEEQDHLRTSGIWGKLVELVLALRFFYFQCGIVYKLKISAGSKSITVYWMSWIYILFCLGAYMLIECFRQKYAAKKHIYYRLVQSLVITFAILGVTALLEFTSFRLVDIFTSLLACIPTGWGIILVAQVLRPILQFTGLWNFVVSAARLYDIMFGVIVMVPVAFLSWIPGFQSMQGRILFNEAFSRGLQVIQIMTKKGPKLKM
ncbi:hypothetical protein Tsubulata_035623, partial [Turnera subulata]